MKSWLLTVVTAVLACHATSAPIPSEDWVGCYDLAQGPWDVAPEATLADQPGRDLRLTAQVFRRKGVLLYNGPDLPTDRPLRKGFFGKYPAIWWVTDSNTVVASTPGLAGAAVKLMHSSSGFTGSVLGFNDILKVDAAGNSHPWLSHAHVTATKVPCQ